MAKDYAVSFYESVKWRKCRDSYAASKYYVCERCGKAGTIVHHKIYITPANINDPNITLNWDNLELLCAACHNKEHKSSDDCLRDGLKFNANGDLILA